MLRFGSRTPDKPFKFVFNGQFRKAAEQKARTTYDNILRLVDDADVRDVIKWLREREIVHYQRFGEAKREVSSNIRAMGSSHPHRFANNTKCRMYELSLN